VEGFFASKRSQADLLPVLLSWATVVISTSASSLASLTVILGSDVSSDIGMTFLSSSGFISIVQEQVKYCYINVA